MRARSGRRRQMAVVFDTATLPVADRAEATRAAIQEFTVPSEVRIEDAAEVRTRLDVAPYGRATIFGADMNGFRLVRSARQARTSPAEVLAVASPHECVGRQEQYGIRRVVAPGQLLVLDLNTAYEYSSTGTGRSLCLFVRIDAVGLPREVVAEAAGRLPASPLYDMMLTHLRTVAAGADTLTGSAAAALGESSIEMVRGLLASAFDVGYARGQLTEMLLPRIRAYVAQHLGDPGLSAESIAAAHGISPRNLFRLCAAADISLEQWIIAERLGGAREDLARPELRSVPIATIARRRGFVNSAHFSRRFRELYGMTPRAWRRLAELDALTGATIPDGAAPGR